MISSINIWHLLAAVSNCLTHLSRFGEVGRVPVGMGMGMSVCTGMHVAISRVVRTSVGHRGRMTLLIGPLLHMQVPLSNRHVDGRPGGLRASSWRFALSALSGEGLELRDG